MDRSRRRFTQLAAFVGIAPFCGAALIKPALAEVDPTPHLQGWAGGVETVWSGVADHDFIVPVYDVVFDHLQRALTLRYYTPVVDGKGPYDTEEGQHIRALHNPFLVSNSICCSVRTIREKTIVGSINAKMISMGYIPRPNVHRIDMIMRGTISGGWCRGQVAV